MTQAANPTPQERARGWVGDNAFLCKHGERNEFRHNYECEICVAEFVRAAQVAARAAALEDEAARLERIAASWENVSGDMSMKAAAEALRLHASFVRDRALAAQRPPDPASGALSGDRAAPQDTENTEEARAALRPRSP